MSSHFQPGDRLLLRDRPWRLLRQTAAGDSRYLFELEALDGDIPSALSVVVPPEEATLLPSQEVQFDLRGIDSLNAWVSAHRLIAATLVNETGMLSGARFGRVALEAYQLVPVVRLLAKPRPSLLIADDVGLGKTIEAGLVMLELMARGRVKRILVVTPPGLMEQWQDELQNKFGLEFTLVEDGAGLSRAQTELPAGLSPWDALPFVITSIDFLKKETVRARALRKRWDLVIVDEAHALAESGTPEYPFRTQRTRLGIALREASRGLLLLTATPHNGYSHSFRSLLELVEPTLASFHGSREDRIRRIEAARVRRMKVQIKRRLPDGRNQVVFPSRNVTGIPISGLSEPERLLLHEVSSYCSRAARAAEGSQQAELIGFAMQIVKKRALSSRYALQQTIEHRLEALRKEEAREEPPDPAEIRDLQADLPMSEAASERTARRLLRSALPAEERQRPAEVKALNGIRRLLKTLPARDAKVEALVRELRAVFEKDPAEKVIVFTEYRDTLEAIRARLDEEPTLARAYVILRGGLTRRQRIRRQEEFELADRRILLATDAASEGLNLQRGCRRVVHFELPWNPNRMEQRNGRVDRYGQTRHPEIRYLFYPDSAEEDVLHQLLVKITAMQKDRISAPDILGLLSGCRIEEQLLRLDPQLADLEDRKREVLEGFEERTLEFARDIQPLISVGQDESESEQARIMELLDTVQPLIPDDFSLEGAILQVLGPRAAKVIPGREGVFRLEVPWNHQGPKVKPLYPAATFRRSVAVRENTDEVEYVTPSHPLVLALADAARQRLLQVYASTRGLSPRRLAAQRLPAGKEPSILFTFLTDIRGGGGLLEQHLLAIRVNSSGAVMGDPLENLKLLDDSDHVAEADPEELRHLFAELFAGLLKVAEREAARWVSGRIEEVRQRRERQAELLLRDLAVDMSDRLREIDQAEALARQPVEDTGQRRLFADAEPKSGGFQARRAAVGAYVAGRREEIGDFQTVKPPEPPRSLGALFLVPAGRAT